MSVLHGALSEAGEIMRAMQEGVLKREDIRADLAELCRGERPGRNTDAAITLFKSVGTALEELAAAELTLKNS